MKYRTTVLSLIASCALFCNAQGEHNLIPQPKIYTPLSDERTAPSILLTEAIPEMPEEWYRIIISGDTLRLAYGSKRGEAWAISTLNQLTDENGTAPQVRIEDWPEFPIRGFMYDTGRNFIEVEQIKEFINLCSDYKLNVFHWHLTDKPAWRIESRVHPELNDARYQRPGRDEGRFYTYDEIRNILMYAHEHGVMIIPEIDMPGHSDYFDATFGTSMASERGREILTDCLNEFFEEFSAEEMPYIHIGSDEIHIDNPDEFMAWALSTVENAGRIPLVWDPGLKGDDNTIYQVWRGAVADKAEQESGKKIVDSFMGYLNVVDPIILPSRLFFHPICNTGKADESHLGGILCLWNDVRVDDNSRLPIHNGMMGAVLPAAERMWNGGGSRIPFNDITRDATDPDMQEFQMFQSKMEWHKEHFLPEELGYWQANRPSTEWELTFTDSIGNILHSGKAYGDAIDFDALLTELGIDSQGVTATIEREIYAENDTTVMCRIGFDAAARSNRNSDGIAEQGRWENYGEVMANGESVLPPEWKEPGKYRFHYHTWAKPEEEMPYTDEQFYWTRQPSEIHLKKGANRITLSTKKHFPTQRFQAALLDL